MVFDADKVCLPEMRMHLKCTHGDTVFRCWCLFICVVLYIFVFVCISQTRPYFIGGLAWAELPRTGHLVQSIYLTLVNLSINK